jgi:hypothetical protein
MSINHKHNNCLVLNADYTPLSIIGWQKALTWLMKHEHDPKYGIDIINFYQDDFIQGVSDKRYPIPAVGKTKKFFKLNNQQVVFSRKNIFLRDNFTCQYCNRQYHHKQLTYDHVIPKSKWNRNNGSPTIWTNIVTACVDCNKKKGNRTPKQANMELQNIPEKPNKNPKYLPISMHIAKIKEQPEEWKLYLPETCILLCQHTHTNA